MRGGLTCIAVCCTLAALGGCGGGNARSNAPVGTSGSVRTHAPSAASAAAEARAAVRARHAERVALERTFAPNPWREPGPSAPHPHGVVRHLMMHDIKQGRGPAVRGDETVYADFVKTYWRSGKKFLTAWGPLRAEALMLLVQSPGMRRGMIGMRPGGRRVIAMPRAISDVHAPDGSGGAVDARVDIVLRRILPRE